MCLEINRELIAIKGQGLVKEVVDLLLDEESTSLAELEAFIGKPIKFQVEQLYTQEQFDVVLM